MEIEKSVNAQKAFFAIGSTLPVAFRLEKLKTLKASIIAHERDIAEALKTDLGKSFHESYMCEIGMTLSELSYLIKHLRSWSRNKHHSIGLANFHSKGYSVWEPYGCVLVMSPWNYPFMLCMEPLAGALAAGNCCMVKPSAYSPATSAIISRIIREVFPPEYVTVVEGGRLENQTLLEQRFDYIFFTGGVTVGKLVMEKASHHLTPVTLELGGKSPCIITDSCDLKVAATRLVFGKFLNCGQTCVAPDYCLVDTKIEKRFLELLKEQVLEMYGENLKSSILKVAHHGSNTSSIEKFIDATSPEIALIGVRTKQ